MRQDRQWNILSAAAYSDVKKDYMDEMKIKHKSSVIQKYEMLTH